jgi:hypothetical protein
MAESYSALNIDRMPEGGFVVTDAGWRNDPSRYCPPLFACTDIGEALRFIRDKLAPAVGAQIGGLHTLKGEPITQEQMDAQMGYRKG